MAKPVKTKKKVKRVVTDAVAHVQASFNNTIRLLHRSLPKRPAAPLAITASRRWKYGSRARARVASRRCVR
jgi:hypothetical protein